MAEKAVNRSVSIRQTQNGVILYAEIKNHASVDGEYVFTSFDELEEHLRAIFLMPTRSTTAGPEYNLGGLPDKGVGNG